MNTTTLYDTIISTQRARVQAYKKLGRITHRQYLNAMAILSNPDFNNLGVKMLNDTLGRKSY